MTDFTAREIFLLKDLRRGVESERARYADLYANYMVAQCDEQLALLDRFIAQWPTLSIERSSEHWLGRPPHCDQRILHAPGECDYCTSAVELQEERARLEVSNSGHSNRRWPCPADVARGPENYHAWDENRPGRIPQRNGSYRPIQGCSDRASPAGTSYGAANACRYDG